MIGVRNEEEIEHLINVLKEAQKALSHEDSLTLKELSNQTIHCATAIQDEGSITSAVLIYTLSKLIERKEYIHIKNWNKFVKRINSFLALAEKALREKNYEAYERHLEAARKSLILISVNIKPYIQEVLRKASINKASKIYEHGLSLGKTAKLLGVTQWELAEYTGQSRISDIPASITESEKVRAKMALEFFS